MRGNNSFFLSLQNVHYTEISVGSVSPSQPVAERWLNTGAKTHILTGRVLRLRPLEPALGVSGCSLLPCPSPGDKDSVGYSWAGGVLGGVSNRAPRTAAENRLMKEPSFQDAELSN